MAVLCLRLLQRDVSLVLIDTHRFAHALALHVEAHAAGLSGTITYGSRRIDLDAVRSVFLRALGPADGMIVSPTDGTPARRRADEVGQAFAAIADALPTTVVNRPAACISNCSKPYQQQLIAAQGFATPRTLITTEPDDARHFIEACDGQVIFKSVSFQRSIVRRMDAAHARRLESLRTCPCQFQEYVPGADVRVHVVRERVFATEIASAAADYRYAHVDGAERSLRPVALPSEVEERCVRLTRALGLEFSGIDLRRHPDGRYYCFEVNTAPGFMFYQRSTGQRIGEAVVDLLCAESSLSSVTAGPRSLSGGEPCRPENETIPLRHSSLVSCGPT
jgi:glutathione synthase/RimK-type ligase-like ATP-grasp enzyme